MKVYTTDRIRNVVVLGHGGSGKTSLVEALAYMGGITSRLGSVAEGNTISDFDKEEIKRKFSINTSVVPVIWGDIKLNILGSLYFSQSAHAFWVPTSTPFLPETTMIAASAAEAASSASPAKSK